MVLNNAMKSSELSREQKHAMKRESRSSRKEETPEKLTQRNTEVRKLIPATKSMYSRARTVA